jgi:hypothetical protein
VDELRVGLDALDVCSVTSSGFPVTFVPPEMDVEGLSSMIVTLFFGYQGRNGIDSTSKL